MKINLEPLSVNTAWKGKRFKTDKYKQFERDMFLLLPKMEIPKDELSVTLIFGFSNKASDIDNPIKPTLDVLQKAYGFNDKDIYELQVIKQIVKKGKEYIEFLIV